MGLAKVKGLPLSIYSEQELDREDDPGGLSSCILSSALGDETRKSPPGHHHPLRSGREVQNMKLILKTYHKLWLALIRGDEKVIQEFIIHFNLAKYVYFWLRPN